MDGISRRQLIVSGALAAGALAGSPRLLREALAAPARAGASPYGALGPPDANGLMLPPGFSSREVARGLSQVAGYPWPVFPDGQATFSTAEGGWILVTNSESLAPTGAGTSAIRFRPDGGVAAAYRILGGTNANCAGGPTPWGTWLSCEEHDSGLVWECDPAGKLMAVARPALGVFNHEAAAVEPSAAAALPDRGQARRRLLSLHAGGVPGSLGRPPRGGAGGRGRPRELARGAQPHTGARRRRPPASRWPR